jgi:DNA-directed RNA polymerase specialized sigma24 family protein
LAAAVGDQRAWDTLVDRHAQQVWDVVRSFGLDASVASAISVLTFRRLADHLDELRTDAEVRSWLCTKAESEACGLLYDAWLSGKPVHLPADR